MKRYQIIVGLLALVLSGCATYHAPPAEIEGGEHKFESKLDYLGRDYIVSPGDELEISYHVDVVLLDEYRLAIGDQLRVEFYHYPQLDRTLDIRPDGKITIPYKGDVDAIGLTPMELSERVNKTYADFLRYPKATVTLIRYGMKIREMKQSIETASRGQSRLARVAPDGRITLPMIAPIMAAGKTIDHIERDVTNAYDEIVQGMFTSASVLAARGNVFYIFGAVQKPGYYELRGPTTMLQGIAIAGGFTDAAKTESTLLISRDEEKYAVGKLMDYREMLKTGNMSADLLIRQADVIFIPNTRLSQMAINGAFIKQMIPIGLSMTYGVDDSVDLVRPNPSF